MPESVELPCIRNSGSSSEARLGKEHSSPSINFIYLEAFKLRRNAKPRPTPRDSPPERHSNPQK